MRSRKLGTTAPIDDGTGVKVAVIEACSSNHRFPQSVSAPLDNNHEMVATNTDLALPADDTYRIAVSD